MTKPPPSTEDTPNVAHGANSRAGIGIPASADKPRTLMLTPDQAVAEIKRLLRQTGMTRDELEAAAADWRLDADQRGALQDIRGLEWLLARAGIPANAWRDAPANTDQEQKERDMVDEWITPDGVNHRPGVAADTLGLPTPTAICRGCRTEWPCDAAINHWRDIRREQA